MTEILIDTNVLISFFDSADKWQPVTTAIFENLKKYPVKIIITDVVINETINVLCKRFEHKKKENEIPALIQKIETDYHTENITWISEEIRSYHSEIINNIRNSNGLLNYNDCFLISFMQKNNIKYIISFDEDFDKIDGIERIYNSKNKIS